MGICLSLNLLNINGLGLASEHLNPVGGLLIGLRLLGVLVRVLILHKLKVFNNESNYLKESDFDDKDRLFEIIYNF